MKTRLHAITARLAFPLLLLAFCAPASADESGVPATMAFEKLKSLAGEWRGKIDERDSGKEASATYRVTSGGNAVVETLFPGTEHEMITVYHLEGPKLVLTHYCTVGNQPKMALTKGSTPDKLVFDFADSPSLNPKKDKHMHALRMSFEAKDRVMCEWDFYADGKKAGTTRFFLTRKA